MDVVEQSSGVGSAVGVMDNIVSRTDQIRGEGPSRIIAVVCGTISFILQLQENYFYSRDPLHMCIFFI